MENELNDNSEKLDDLHSLRNSGKHVGRAYFWNILSVYGVIPINLIITALVSRFLTPDYWGIYIYVHILIAGSQIISIFIPPSINAVILYQIPELIIKKQYSKVKGYIAYFIKVKSILVSLMVAGFIIFALILLKLEIYTIHALLILLISPCLYIQEIFGILLLLTQATKKFEINTKLRFQEKIIILVGYIVLFFVDCSQETKLIGMAIVFLLSLLGFIPKLLISYHQEFGQYPIEKINHKDIKTSILFGASHSVTNSLYNAYEQIYYGIVNIVGLNFYNSYNNIMKNFSTEAITGLSPDLGPVLSDLEKTNQREKMFILFYKSFNLSNLLITFVIGIFFFISDFYILVIYPPDYLAVIPLLKIYILIVFFLNITQNYHVLYSITNNVKKMWQIDFIIVIIGSIMAIIGMLLFNFQGLVISRVIAFAIGSLLFWFYTKKYLHEFEIPLFNVYRHFIALLIIIISINYLEKRIISPKISNNFVYDLLNIMNSIIPALQASDYFAQMLMILKVFINLSLFLLLYLIYVIFFKAIVKQDIEQLERLNLKIPFKKQIFRLLKRITFTKSNKKPIN